MLNTLNQLFVDQPNFKLGRNLSNKESFSSKEFTLDVARLVQVLNGSRPQRWLVTFEEPYLFLVSVIALLAADKTVIFSANRKQIWLQEIESEFDALIGTGDLGLELNQEPLEFNLLTLRQWELSENSNIDFTGEEQLVFFTSGSTGKPKKVIKKLSYITSEVENLEKTFGDSLAQSIFVSSVSHFHIYGLLFNLFWPLLSSREFISEMLEFEEQLVELTKKESLLCFISSPAFLSRLDCTAILSAKISTFSSGGPLSFKSAKKVHNLLGQLPVEVYGSTETGGIAHRQQQSESEPWVLFEQVSLSESNGDKILRSPYIDSDTAFVIDDKIEMLGNGTFVLLGRKDRIVKIEEKRVSLDEIEDFLKCSRDISDSICLMLEGQRSILGVVLVLTIEGQRQLAEIGRKEYFMALKRTMRSRFENVTIPRKWRVLEKMPVNQQSKRDYVQLASLFE